MTCSEPPLYERVGFDYSAALLELSQKMTYDQLAEQLGYKGKSSVAKVIKGSPPSHRQGEAIWALYCDTFGRKPPLNVRQSEPQME